MADDVVRGFIPEGEEPTAREKVVYDASSYLAIKPGFIPGPDSEPMPHKHRWAEREVDREQKRQRAANLALRAVARSNLEAYDEAKKRLVQMTVPEALAFLETMPEKLQELWLLAEEDTQNRKTLFSYMRRGPSQELRAQLFPSVAEETNE